MVSGVLHKKSALEGRYTSSETGTRVAPSCFTAANFRISDMFYGVNTVRGCSTSFRGFSASSKSAVANWVKMQSCSDTFPWLDRHFFTFVITLVVARYAVCFLQKPDFSLLLRAGHY